MITEDYCSYEVSKLLKDKGFDEPTPFVWYEKLPAQNAVRDRDIGQKARDLFYYNETTENAISYKNSIKKPRYIYGDLFSAPTHQMAMKWLREVHNILIVVSITYEKERYDWYICGIKGDPWEKKLFHEEKDITYATYEEAVEAALKYVLNNLL